MTLPNDTDRAAHLRDLERRLRTDADACRTKADQAHSQTSSPGSVLSDYQRDVARHWWAMAATADFHADRAAEQAADREAHAMAGAA